MAHFQLAQLNVARMRAPLEAPLMAGFVARLDEINKLAEAAPGFIWRLQTEEGDATALRPFDADLLVNLTVWADLESLASFVYRTAHSELMRQRGLDYKQMEIETGCLMAVVEANARYQAPARYDDELIVETTVTGVRGPVVRFRYQILRADDRTLLCEGDTVHVVVGRDMKRCAMPRKYAALLSAAASHAAL